MIDKKTDKYILDLKEVINDKEKFVEAAYNLRMSDFESNYYNWHIYGSVCASMVMVKSLNSSSFKDMYVKSIIDLEKIRQYIDFSDSISINEGVLNTTEFDNNKDYSKFCNLNELVLEEVVPIELIQNLIFISDVVNRSLYEREISKKSLDMLIDYINSSINIYISKSDSFDSVGDDLYISIKDNSIVLILFYLFD